MFAIGSVFTSCATPWLSNLSLELSCESQRDEIKGSLSTSSLFASRSSLHTSSSTDRLEHTSSFPRGVVEQTNGMVSQVRSSSCSSLARSCTDSSPDTASRLLFFPPSRTAHLDLRHRISMGSPRFLWTPLEASPPLLLPSSLPNDHSTSHVSLRTPLGSSAAEDVASSCKSRSNSPA